jgi:hypothetical protein
MQDIGGKEDTELKREGLSLSSCEFPVESLGHCQSAGNWFASIVDGIQGAEEIYAHSEKKAGILGSGLAHLGLVAGGCNAPKLPS